jgi:hypothetical protein
MGTFKSYVKKWIVFSVYNDLVMDTVRALLWRIKIKYLIDAEDLIFMFTMKNRARGGDINFFSSNIDTKMPPF